jgi:hypothetical protein
VLVTVPALKNLKPRRVLAAALVDHGARVKLYLSATSQAREHDNNKNKGPAVAGQALDLTGGATGNRTPDLYNAIVALSHLSYDPEPRAGRSGARLAS